MREEAISSVENGPMIGNVGKDWESTNAKAIVVGDTFLFLLSVTALFLRSKFSGLFHESG